MPEQDTVGLLAWLAMHAGVAKEDIVLTAPAFAIHTDVLIIRRAGKKPEPIPDAGSSEKDGKRVRIQIVPESELKGISGKLASNCAAIPGFAMLAKASIDFPAHEDFLLREHDSRRLPCLRKSRDSWHWMADLVGSILSALGRFGRGSMQVRYLSESEISLIAKMQNWILLQGKEEAGPWLQRQVEYGISLQFILMHMVFLQRCLEDVNGMIGTRSPASVLISARTGFLQLARAMLAAQGFLLDSESMLLRKGSALAKQMRVILLRGSFPSLEDADDYLDWFHAEVESQTRLLNACAPLKLLLKQICTFVKSDIGRNRVKACGPRPYVYPKFPAGREAMDSILSEYATSGGTLLNGIQQLKPEDSVILSGSIAAGLGHPRSDLDLMVMTRSLPEIRANGVTVANGHMECYCPPTAKGNAVCGEFLSLDLLTDVSSWWARIESALTEAREDGGESSPSGRLIQAGKASPYAKLVDRVLNGFPLQKGAFQSTWELSLPREKFASFLRFSHLLEGQQWLRKAGNHGLGEECIQETVLDARMAWESLLSAYLAGRGISIWSKRWLPEELGRVEDAELLRLGLAGLFPEPAGAGYLEWVVRHQHILIGKMETDKDFPEAWNALCADNGKVSA